MKPEDAARLWREFQKLPSDAQNYVAAQMFAYTFGQAEVRIESESSQLFFERVRSLMDVSSVFEKSTTEEI